MKIFLAASAFLVLALPAAAHGPTPQKVEEKISITADPKAVWALIANFGDVAKWHSEVSESESPEGNTAGATRKLTLKGGATITEDLDEYDPAAMTYSYRLDEGNLEALPVSFYSATIKVEPGENGGSTVEWFGRLYRGDTGNFPPENLNDEAAVKAVSTFFKTGLESLKSKAEHKS